MCGSTNHLKKHVREGALTMSTILWPNGDVELRFETAKNPPPTATPFKKSVLKVVPSIEAMYEKGTSDV